MEPNERAVGDRPASSLPHAPRRGAPSGGLRGLLLRLMRGEDLTREESPMLLDALLDGETTDSQIAATLVALRVKGETAEELAAMAAAMRSRAARIRSRHARFIDTAGTGSSAAKTFNVSTAAAFVTAGAGLPVAKHGGRAATSRSGSADVLSALGVNVSATAEYTRRCLDDIGLCFMFSPLYHSATARVAAIRSELGVPTTFNLLGPLSNPAAAPRQLIGVWHRSLLEPMARALVILGSEHAWVVYGADGLDEVSLGAQTYVAEVRSGRIRTFETTPEDFGARRASTAHLCCGDAGESAGVIASILNCSRRDEARDLVLLNAAAALFIGGIGADFSDARRLAELSIESGAAMGKLEMLVQMTNVETRRW